MEEAAIAIRSGADALGFLIGLNYQTDDEIDPSAAKRIIAALPPFIASVLVTHRREPDWVAEMCHKIGCSTVQLHGDFPIEQIPALRKGAPHARIIKAVHVVDAGAVGLARDAGRWADAIVLDSRTSARIGGTGATHDWSISSRIVKEANKAVILSGGLNPENVRDAIAVVSPFAVDVNSGVENPDGSKSRERTRSFIQLAKAAGEPSPLTAEILSGSAWR
jgi:phosphoribosylanthranilate isomerase